jgi:NADPH:quinone reductase-like Zn-dependent oxidoreductase/acyl carrier protein
VVTEVGPEVTGLTPGDPVMGILPGVGPVAVADHRVLARIPAGWSFAQAAGAPVVFLTAYRCLAGLAGVRPGEAVLIHAGTGGVGMAAIQVARHLGARVYATASPEKWPVLRSLGLDEDSIASSRTVEYAARFGPVDVVLNSLAGEHVDASLSLLRDGGRFVDIGKTDPRDPVCVAEAHPGVTYRSFDLLADEPDLIRRALIELGRLFASGALRPLPVTAWDVRGAPEAMRHLGAARHTGKLVLTVPPPWNPDGTVLITGAGTLAGLTARHLVTRHGARRLLLASRSGAAPALTEELRGLGAAVTVAACDVADPAALAAVLDGIGRRHPLTAVVHTAGVLDDATVETLTAARVDAILRAKAESAWHLHALTRDRPPCAFVLFSSVAATLGTPGQAGYAAANAVLDALATQRQADGRPAVSIGWGLWDEVTGMAGTLDAADRARLRRHGVAAMPAADALALLDAALAGGRPAVVAATLDLTPDGIRPPILADLSTAFPPAADRAVDPPSLAARLTGKDGAEQHRLLLDLVRGTAATVLGRDDPDRIRPTEVFKELGFDSLAAVEFRNRIGVATGLRLPPTLTFDHPTPASLADHLRERFATPDPPPASAAGHVVERIEELVAALEPADAERVEVAARLRELLWRLEAAPHGDADDDTDDDLIAALESELGSPPG